FYFFSALILGSALVVVVNRNPVTSAMFLILVFFFLAGLFVLLHAFFLAVIQVLVYAGAVMVLFLFVVMLLDIRPTPLITRNTVGIAGGVFLAVLFFIEFWLILQQTSLPSVSGEPPESGASAIGELLFTRYVLPFEITSVLLLSALVGVVLICRKEAR
ncbi:MAG: NADH-quinone oxidoreductase subunit J, partial [Verrucomicrobiae bacterium]|nr:NADH-quinone oxidoreductase subunit J [Verrucomicrobiae bacterium]